MKENARNHAEDLKSPRKLLFDDNKLKAVIFTVLISLKNCYMLKEIFDTFIILFLYNNHILSIKAL